MLNDLRYRLIDMARGTDSVGLLADLRSWQFDSPQSLEARSKQGLAQYFDDMRRQVPMFADVARFEDLPVLDKRFINGNREALMNQSYTGRRVRKKTGGSTGEPLVYFTGVESQSYLWAGIFLSWEAAGYRFGDKVAFLAGSSLFGTGYKQRVYYKLLNVTVMSAFDMSPDQMKFYGEALRTGKFRLLYGYASAIHRLATYLLSSGTSLANCLRGVVCTAEMLTPQMRADIEAAFGVPCFSQYGCNDAGVSAFECEHRNGFHLLSTRSHAEVLEGGRLISTDLSNRAMFMPRYDTGDLVRMSGRLCPCGRGLPLIDEVVGRQNDMVIDPNGAAVHSEFFTHMFREDARIQSFQVVFSSEQLVINVHGPDLSAAEQVMFAGPYLERIEASVTFPSMRFEYNKPFQTQANSKHRFVLRHPGN
ncbi:phenylacetate--CoA ligase family protein [Kinneretia aquatilis]|uniref:phenylacetate--CoA ligase family protein n=1 Tax=Kinneretia aquatilis TaxID=2070761 RepID=UPI0014951D6E|nr:phenylacetate--CoA ligase family protein [Paucibacter aquatile]WIV96552.1 phenylacetate--CoA ligase family protein [Paucibacter aquatile]